MEKAVERTAGSAAATGVGSEPPSESGRHLLGSRRFAPFFLTQFLGAFNDNLFKNALVILLTFQAAGWSSLSPGLLSNLAAALFILPFVLCSATAGQLADKYDKAWLARQSKLLEILVMALAAVGFALRSLPLLLLALFLMGLQSALFGPVKYAILPQHLRPAELLAGNAWVEAATFVAILLGTLAGALLAAVDGAAAWISLVCVALAVTGYASSRAIPPAPAAAPQLAVDRNPLAALAGCLRAARQQREVWHALLAISWFWLLGALFLAQFPALVQTLLRGDEVMVSVLLLVFTCGIGCGSYLCQRLAGDDFGLGLVLPAALSLTLFAADFAWSLSLFAPSAALTATWSVLLAEPAVWRLLFDLLAVGLSGGLFIVPLYTLMQLRSPPAQRARLVAANNILNAAFMVGGALAAMLLLAAGVSLAGLFFCAAAGNLLFALWLAWRASGYWAAWRQRWRGRMRRS